YLVRRLLENTSNESFLRASFRENVPEEQLLMNPTNHAGPLPDGRGSDDVALKPFQNEPFTDFSRDDNRKKMQDALARVKSQLGKTYPLVIGGERVKTKDTFPSVNPSRTNELIGHVAKATKQDALRAIAAASQAFERWRDTDPKERAQL